jgi:hypothetical protein
MDYTKQVLEIIYQQLNNTHDVKNTQIRMFQIAKDPSLILTPGQRGALNYYSAQHDPHPTESTLAKLLNDIITATPSNTSLSNFTTSSHSSLSFEPVIKKIKDGFQWSIVLSDTLQPITIDPTHYMTLEIAQQRADQFLLELKKGSDKQWIHLGIVQWAQNINQQRPSACSVEILHIQQHYYLFVASPIQDHTKEIQEQKTVFYTSKILELENLVQPEWLARGVTSGLFYLVYKLNTQSISVPLHTLTQQLSTLICK